MSDERNRPNNLLLEVESIARLAGEAILEVYDSSDLSASLKPDQSPVTAADLVSEEVIRNGLMQLSVQYLIVSEESTSISFEERVAANRLWIVDPLDGTKEFLKRNDEFCVCIALIEKRRPILGVIHAPVSGKSYLAAKGEGVLVRSASGEFSQLSPKPRAPSIGTNDLRFGVSRSHLNQATKDYLLHFEKPRLVPMGSALKFCALAEGMLDVYPRFGPTMEWDTAAGDLIVHESGGSLRDSETNEPLSYNKSVLVNSSFIAKGHTLNVAR